MANLPAKLPTNYVALPAETRDHPGGHNLANQTINDLIDYVAALAAGGGGGEPPPPDPGDGGLAVVTSPTRVVNVSSRSQLLTALTGMQWGDKIVLAGTTASPVNYGSTSLNTEINTPSMSGFSVTNPPPGVWIYCAQPNGAIFDRGPTSGGYSMFLNRANYLQLENVKVTGGEKGIMAHRSNYCRIINCDIGNCGHEAVHFRIFSSYNVIDGCDIHDTGDTNPAIGEGVYFGQSESTWGTTYAGDSAGGQPDKSSYNTCRNCTIRRTTAECVDLKEGSEGHLIENNSFDGSALSGQNNADSLIDVKSNDCRIVGNTNVGTGANQFFAYGYQTHILYAGYGQRNLFDGNTISMPSASTGFGIEIQLTGSRGTATGNVVLSNNVKTGGSGALTNITVTAA